MDFDLDKYDAILVLDNQEVNENKDIKKLLGGTDNRAYASTGPYVDRGAYSDYLNYNDPKLFASWSFGNQIQNALSNIGNGIGCEVADYGRYVSVKVTCSNPPTGKSASKTFLVVFEPDGKKGQVYATSNRYRTFSGVSQAATYIKASAGSLRSSISTV